MCWVDAVKVNLIDKMSKTKASGKEESALREELVLRGQQGTSERGEMWEPEQRGHRQGQVTGDLEGRCKDFGFVLCDSWEAISGFQAKRWHGMLLLWNNPPGCPAENELQRNVQLSRVWLFVTPWTVCSPPGSSIHRILQEFWKNSPRIPLSMEFSKNTGAGCHFLLQREMREK